MYIMKQLSFIFLTVLLYSSNVYAQLKTNSTEVRSLGKESIKQLSKGTLIVRLSKFELDVESIKAYKGEQGAFQEQKRIFEANKNLIQEFKKDYSFSDIVFAYDTKLHEYLQDSTLRIFLNEDLEVNTSISIKNGPIYILSSNGNKYYKIYDQSWNLLEKPTPQFINRHFDREYKFLIAIVVQKINNLMTRNLSASKLNEKLIRWNK